MKLITAFIHPIMVDRVARALRNAGARTFAVANEHFSSSESAVTATSSVLKSRFDIPVTDAQEPIIFNLIQHTVEPDSESDFLIYVTEIARYKNSTNSHTRSI